MAFSLKLCNLSVLSLDNVLSESSANLRSWQDGSGRSCGKMMGLVADNCVVGWGFSGRKFSFQMLVQFGKLKVVKVQSGLGFQNGGISQLAFGF